MKELRRMVRRWKRDEMAHKLNYIANDGKNIFRNGGGGRNSVIDNDTQLAFHFRDF